MIREPQGKDLDDIINEMIDVVENSKQEVFTISDEARHEYKRLSEELVEIQKKVLSIIEEGDELDSKVRSYRKKLSKVSKRFDIYTEEQIREVYEDTLALQTKLAMLRREEKTLRYRRDDLERRLISIEQTIERAEGLTGKISVVLNYLQDDFKQVNEIIEDAREKQAFSLKIIQAQEEERRRISREIHDGPAQMLANILLRSELVDRALRDQNVDYAKEEIKSIRKVVRSSLYEVRHIIYDLRPMALDDLGLVPTIKKYIHTTSDYYNIEIRFNSIGEMKRLNQNYEIALFRLLQESLQNAVKHADASLIHVRLEFGSNNINLSITDNGIGFDPKNNGEHSFGIIGMRERVEMLDGKFQIVSELNKGTKIFITIPYE